MHGVYANCSESLQSFEKACCRNTRKILSTCCQLIVHAQERLQEPKFFYSFWAQKADELDQAPTSIIEAFKCMCFCNRLFQKAEVTLNN